MKSLVIHVNSAELQMIALLKDFYRARTFEDAIIQSIHSAYIARSRK